MSQLASWHFSPTRLPVSSECTSGKLARFRQKKMGSGVLNNRAQSRSDNLLLINS